MADRIRHAKGVFCALTGASLWGFSGACAQYLLSGYGVDASFLTAARMVGASVVFVVVLVLHQRATLVAMLTSRRTLGQLFVFGVALYLSQITYTVVIGYTNAGTATVLQTTGIAFVLLYACLAGRRLPRLREAVGLVAAVVATWLIATQGDASVLSIPFAGLVWGLLNGLAVAFYLVYPKRLFSRWGSFAATGLGMVAGGVVATAAFLVSGFVGVPLAFPALDGTGVTVLALFILVGTFAAFALYLHGVSLVGSVEGGLLGAIEPVSATVISALWLGSAFSGFDVAGMLLMIAMIFLVTGKGAAKEEDNGVQRG